MMGYSEDGEAIACPSARAKPGSELLGIRQEDGTIAILPQPLPVDGAFMEIAHRSPTPPEQRFRFTNKCIERGCKQWDGKGCGIAKRVTEFLNKIPSTAELPACNIRPRCRWFVQEGPDACRICPYIITEITEEEARQYWDNLDSR